VTQLFLEQAKTKRCFEERSVGHVLVMYTSDRVTACYSQNYYEEWTQTLRLTFELDGVVPFRDPIRSGAWLNQFLMTFSITTLEAHHAGESAHTASEKITAYL